MFSRVVVRSRNSLLRKPLDRTRIHAPPYCLRPSLLSLSVAAKRLSSTEAASSAQEHQHDLVGRQQAEVREKTRKLPQSCPGCGAPSQTVTPEEAGFYSLGRSAVKKFVQDDAKQEDLVFRATLDKVDSNVLQELGLNSKALDAQEQPQKQTPICDRCHNLLHHHTGVPIFHPSIDSIRSIIEESPHKNNHIYHVLDAADFPMSLIPNLLNRLDLPALRTQNRRSKHRKYVRDRIADVSFIITRSDLLAPNKEQVDSLMPYLRETLRDALGRTGRNVRLGGLRCVSSKRGWWTKQVKEDIWERGGAAWMVGKVNVGKSNLFEVAFPKGRGQEKLPKPQRMNVNLRPDTASASTNPSEPFSDLPDLQSVGVGATAADTTVTASGDAVVESQPGANAQDEPDVFDVEEGSLLPPAQIEVPYPVMPVISSLPGTTASPIRVPFGSGKGELIDLPGVARSNLDEFVLPEHQQDLVMRSRVTPEQMSIKPGRSLILGGGLVRITPTTPDLVFLSYTFLPLSSHITSTDKAMDIVNGKRMTGLQTIMTKEARENMASAGTFKLEWDVTKQRAGPLTSNSAARLKADQLPFIVYSADILVEGVGWVELVAQVRRKQKIKPTYTPSLDKLLDDDTPSASSNSDTTTWKPLMTPEEHIVESTLPQVEVFSPKGKFIGVRPPMSAWLLGGKKSPTASARKSRPRLSMKSLKHSQRGREAQREG